LIPLVCVIKVVIPKSLGWAGHVEYRGRREMHVVFSLESLLLPKENLGRPVSDSHFSQLSWQTKEQELTKENEVDTTVLLQYIW